MGRRARIAVAALPVALGAAWLASRRASPGAEEPAAAQREKKKEAAAKIAGAKASATFEPAAKTPDPNGTISGSVRDTEGRAIAGALVCAEGTDDPTVAPDAPDDPSALCATTARDGTYALAGLPGGTYDLRVSVPEHYLPPASAFAVDLDPGGSETDADFVVVAGAVRVGGKVADTSGAPIAGALVVAAVTLPSGDVETSTRADAGGAFELWLPPGAVEATASAPGYVPATASGVAPGGSLAFALLAESTIAGRTVDPAGAPIAGVVVTAAEVTEAGDRSARSDANGRFWIRGLEPGRYALSGRAKGWAGRSSGSVLLGLGETKEDLEVVLSPVPTASLEGRVTVEGTGEPCPYPAVTLSKEDDFVDATGYEDGVVTVPDLAPGEWAVTVACDGFASLDEYPLAIAEQDAHHAYEWRVRAGGSISGVVLGPGDVPAAGGTVSIMGESEEVVAFAPVGERGVFALKGLNPGVYQLTPEVDGFLYEDEPARVEVGAGEDVKGVRLHVVAGGTVAGHVFDSAGAPMPGVSVVVAVAYEEQRASARTDDEGAFTIAGIAGGQAWLSVEDLDSGEVVPLAGRGAESSAADGIDVVEGKTVARDLVVEARTGRIAGVVLDEQGRPLAGAFVAALREVPGEPAFFRREPGLRRAVTDASGRFTLDRLPRDTFTVLARRRGGAYARVEHVTPGRDVTIALEPGARLTGVVLGLDGAPCPRFVLSLVGINGNTRRTETFRAADGRFAIDELAADTYDIVVGTRDAAVVAVVEIQRDRTPEELVLRLAPRQGLLDPEY